MELRKDKEECDWWLGLPVLNTQNSVNYSLSDPIFSTSDVFIVPPGKPFTSWEKLLMPFDRWNWIGLVVVFVISYFIILLVKLSHSKSMNILDQMLPRHHWTLWEFPWALVKWHCHEGMSQDFCSSASSCFAWLCEPLIRENISNF